MRLEDLVLEIVDMATRMTGLRLQDKKRGGRAAVVLLALGLFLSFGSNGVSANCTAIVGNNAINWTATSSNWSTASNWNLDCTPNNGTPTSAFYDVTINNGTGTVTFDNGAATIDTLTLGTNATLSDNSSSEQLTFGSANAVGSLTNAGIINWGNGSGNTLTINVNSATASKSSPTTFTETNSGTINLLSGGTISINDGIRGDTISLTGGGTVNLSGGTINSAPADTKVSLTNTNNMITGFGTISSLNVTNSTGGTINVTGGTLTVTPNSSGFTNQGAVTISSTGTLTVNGTYTQTNSASSTSIAAGGNLSTGTQSFTQNGGTTTVNGTLTSATAGVFITKGAFQGTGTVQGNVTMTAGTLTPGSPIAGTPDTLTINGGFDMTGGTFDELIGTAGSGSLDVNGAVTLGGTSTFNVTIAKGASPAVGTIFEIIDPSSLSGEFSNTSTFDGTTFNNGTEQWELLYDPANDPNGVELEAVATPEPNVLIMVSAGLLALAIFSRKNLSSAAR
jgi:hypothetical protein